MELELFLKAKHFKNTNFADENECALEKACLDQLDCKEVHENLVDIEIDGKDFSHEYYGILEFQEDQIKAKKLGFNDEVIRTIELISL